MNEILEVTDVSFVSDCGELIIKSDYQNKTESSICETITYSSVFVNESK